ncbi:hypothetical protein WDV85_10405 [Pseudokineococcus sp. 5B2Z-1]|uniref:hypothetical protein n=1 Tax=Pseudokineococcus sp. 5B2Z-1 TaxID=3132744 RepID=UPI00309908D5
MRHAAAWGLVGAGLALVVVLAAEAIGVSWAWWSAAALGAALVVLGRAAVAHVGGQTWPSPWSTVRRPGRAERPDRWAVTRARSDLDAARTSAPARRLLHERLARAGTGRAPEGGTGGRGGEVGGAEVGGGGGGPAVPEHLLRGAEDALGLRPDVRAGDLGRWGHGGGRGAGRRGAPRP